MIGGHLGVNKTMKKLKSQRTWRGMKRDVKNYIKNCASCQMNKNTNHKLRQSMIITSTSTILFKKIFLDILGPLITTLTGNNYILTQQCDFSKLSMGIPLPNHQANTIAKAFVKTLCLFT